MSTPSPSESVASVLVVDDDPGVLTALAELLGQEGFEVATAPGGAEAIKLAREIRFDVVVCDLRMDGLSGEDTLAAIKAIDPEIEVVMGTGHASVDTAVECMRRGAFDYLTKPYTRETLLRVIRRALESSQLHGAVELSDAARTVASLSPGALTTELPLMAARVFRSEAAALVLQREAELSVYLSEPRPGRDGAVIAPPSPALVRSLAVRGVQTSAPFRFVSPRQEGLSANASDDAYAAALVCPLRTADVTEGALVLLRGQGSPPFTIAVVRRAITFAGLVSLAAARLRTTTAAPRALPESLGRLLRDARQNVEVLRRGTDDGERALRLERLSTIVSALQKLLGTE